MRKLLIVGLLFLASCGEEGKEVVVNDRFKEVWIKNEAGIDGVAIYTIDGCEYIWVKHGYGAGLTHKANCVNH
jgi:hypothetical protein